CDQVSCWWTVHLSVKSQTIFKESELQTNFNASYELWLDVVGSNSGREGKRRQFTVRESSSDSYNRIDRVSINRTGITVTCPTSRKLSIVQSVVVLQSFKRFCWNECNTH